MMHLLVLNCQVSDGAKVFFMLYPRAVLDVILCYFSSRFSCMNFDVDLEWWVTNRTMIKTKFRPPLKDILCRVWVIAFHAKEWLIFFRNVNHWIAPCISFKAQQTSSFHPSTNNHEVDVVLWKLCKIRSTVDVVKEHQSFFCTKGTTPTLLCTLDLL